MKIIILFLLIPIVAASQTKEIDSLVNLEKKWFMYGDSCQKLLPALLHSNTPEYWDTKARVIYARKMQSRLTMQVEILRDAWLKKRRKELFEQTVKSI